MAWCLNKQCPEGQNIQQLNFVESSTYPTGVLVIEFCTAASNSSTRNEHDNLTEGKYGLELSAPWSTESPAATLL